MNRIDLRITINTVRIGKIKKKEGKSWIQMNRIDLRITINTVRIGKIKRKEGKWHDSIYSDTQDTSR